jgi:hypothetical protein
MNTKSSPKELRIILIRHGEKPEVGDNLSCKGFNRALKLANVLYSRYGLPDHIYVPAPGLGKETKNCRMIQTILPFAIKNNQDINTKFKVDETSELAEALKSQRGNVFVVWEHVQLQSIVKSLGVTAELPEWGSSDFDSIWIVTIKKGVAVLTKDRENIVPADGCPF